MRLPLLAPTVCAAALAACGSSSTQTTAGAGTTPASTAATTTPTVQSAPTAQADCPTGRSTAHLPGAPLNTILRVSAANRTRRAPLVVALHFAGGPGRAMEQQTGLTTEARRAGFDVAYPTAPVNGFWRASDLPKLRQTITAIEQAACVDTSRVYLLGWSNGGGMAALGACQMSDTIAAVAMFAPATGFAKTCAPARKPSVLEVHGTSDPIVPYASGRSFIGAWARRDGCSASATTSRLRSRGTLLRWTGCDDGASVQHLRVARARHIQLFSDIRAARLDPNATAWRFLSAHRLT
jgi:poly(3-hydroxybutyrate) depolymerase